MSKHENRNVNYMSGLSRGNVSIHLYIYIYVLILDNSTTVDEQRLSLECNYGTTASVWTMGILLCTCSTTGFVTFIYIYSLSSDSCVWRKFDLSVPFRKSIYRLLLDPTWTDENDLRVAGNVSRMVRISTVCFAVDLLCLLSELRDCSGITCCILIYSTDKNIVLMLML